MTQGPRDDGRSDDFMAKPFVEPGYEREATRSRLQFVRIHDVPDAGLFEVREGRPQVAGRIENGEMPLVMNTPPGRGSEYDARCDPRARRATGRGPATGNPPIVFRRPASVLLAAALALSSCAYYNTFYLARKNYNAATLGEPYLVAGSNTMAQSRFNKAVDYSKKLIAAYPKSKWVDDAYLIWARSLLGKDDPLKTVDMLKDFDRQYPKSPLRSEALFYLGVAYRQAHRPKDALATLDDFLAISKPVELVPYALLERSRVLMTLERPGEAASAAGQLLERFPKSGLLKGARVARAEALLNQGEHEKARADFHSLGLVAADDEERFSFVLREADCLEGARQYDEQIALLKDVLSHEQVPTPPPPIAGQPAAAPTGLGADHYGRLRMRIGTTHLLAGRFDMALAEYREVVTVYPRTGLASEAQYRIGYAFETIGDDLDKARTEYGKVREQGGQGAYSLQALTRLANLDRLMQFRTAGGKDSVEKSAEAGFLLAELYLFQLGKPERAIEEYRKISLSHPGLPLAGKALNAEAWVLGRKLDRKAEAESLFWKVVREYPATEAQLAARDYLEAGGVSVPSELIRLPEPPPPAPVDSVRLTPIPQGSIPLGSGVDSSLIQSMSAGSGRSVSQLDSLRARMGLPSRSRMLDSLGHRRMFSDSTGAPYRPGSIDSTRRVTAPVPTPADTTRRVTLPVPPPADTTRLVTVPAPADTTRGGTAPAPPDSSRRR